MNRKYIKPENKKKGLGFKGIILIPIFGFSFFLLLSNTVVYFQGKNKGFDGIDYVLSKFYGKETSSFYVLDYSYHPYPPHQLLVKEPNKFYTEVDGRTIEEDLKTGRKRVLDIVSKTWDEYLEQVGGEVLNNISTNGGESTSPSDEQEQTENQIESKGPKIGDIRTISCKNCNGKKIQQCDRCVGTGTINGVNRYGDYGLIYCPNCKGTGQHRCNSCLGDGVNYEEYGEFLGELMWKPCIKCQVKQFYKHGIGGS